MVTPFDEWAPKFSPNGRWIAYASNESRRDEIYGQAVQGGEKHRISSDGGIWPVWAPNGRELFFLNGINLMIAKMDPASGAPSQPTRLLTVSNLMILQNEKSPPTQLNMILNWFEGLKARVPADAH